MNTSLDERLHIYFDGLDADAVPGTAEQAITRAGTRRRHQIGGLAGCIVLVLAGLGIGGSLLLNDDERSSGPVAIRPGGDEPTGGSWIVGSSAPELGRLREARLVDEAIIGLTWIDHQAGDDEDDPWGWQVLRDDGDGGEIVDTGIDLLHHMTGAGDDLYAVGEMGVDGKLGLSVSRPGDLAIAHSSDAGRSWNVGIPDVELPDDLSQLQVTAADDFLVVHAHLLGDGEAQDEDVLYTFDRDDLQRPAATNDASIGQSRPYASGGGMIAGLGTGDHLWTLDGRDWMEATPPTENVGLVAILADAPVWVGWDRSIVEIDGTSTDLSQLLDAPQPFVSPTLIGSTGDELVLVARVDDTPDGYRLLRTKDGIEWSTTPLPGPPEGFADVSYVNSFMTFDDERRVMIDAVLSPSDTDLYVPTAVLVIEPTSSSRTS